MIVIDGKAIAAKIESHIRSTMAERHVRLSLASLFVGNAADSALYTKRKAEAAARLGVSFDVYQLDAAVPASEVAEQIAYLNEKPRLDGYIVQLPLPEHLRHDTNQLLALIDSRRDVDGLTTENRQRVLDQKRGSFYPTPVAAVLVALASLYSTVKWEKKLQFQTGRLPRLVPTELKGKSAVIISDGDVFGLTLKAILEEGGLDVVVERSDALTLERSLRAGRLVVTAVGKPGLLKGDMIATEAIVIDVGTTLVEGRTRGDLDWPSVSEKVYAATPVPGGIGPITVAMLYANLLNLKLHPLTKK